MTLRHDRRPCHGPVTLKTFLVMFDLHAKLWQLWKVVIVACTALPPPVPSRPLGLVKVSKSDRITWEQIRSVAEPDQNMSFLRCTRMNPRGQVAPQTQLRRVPPAPPLFSAHGQVAPQAQLEESANDRGVHASYALVANQLIGILRPEPENPEPGSRILSFGSTPAAPLSQEPSFERCFS